jgi:hypothetical protein
MDAEVSALSDYPEFVPVVARWHWQEWGHTDPGGTLAVWTAGLARQADANRYRARSSRWQEEPRLGLSAWSRVTCPGTKP